MDKHLELERSLQQLKKITGLDLSLKVGNEAQISELITQVRQLSSAYNERYNKDFFIRKWIKGQISDEEAIDIAKKMHISMQEQRILYLIQAESDQREDVLTILKNMYPYEANIWVFRLEPGKILLLQSFFRKTPDRNAMAREIVDTLGSEAMIPVKISYSRVMQHFYELPSVYQEVNFAMKVGMMFQCDENIYGFDQLGMGRLLYTLPEDICEGYLKETIQSVYGNKRIDAFQMDVLKMVDCFLDNNLNIAETARQLHIHRNTLLYRMDQIEKELGLDIRKFNHAMTYKMASMVFQKLYTKALS